MHTTELISSLGSRDQTVWLPAQNELAALGGQAVPYLLEAMESQQNPVILSKLLVVAAAIGHPDMADCLERLKANEHSLVRMSCAGAIAAVRGEDGLPLLFEWLAVERDPLVQASIVRAVDTLSSRAAIPDLVKVLLVADNALTRLTIVRALGNIGDPVVVETLVPYLNDRDRHVQKEVREALKKLGEDIGTHGRD